MWKLQTLLERPLDAVGIHHDAWAIKKLFTHSLKRSGSDSRNSLENRSPVRRVSSHVGYDIFVFFIVFSCFFTFGFATSRLSKFPSLPFPFSCNPRFKAAGVGEYYEILYKHWDGPLKALEAQRAERVSKGQSKAAVIEIEDDDGADLVALENLSLEQARNGIVLPGVVVIDDPEGGKEKKGGKCEKGEVVNEGTAGTDAARPLPEPFARGVKFRMTIDDVLNPPNLPPMSPRDVNKEPARPKSMGECEERIKYLQ